MIRAFDLPVTAFVAISCVTCGGSPTRPPDPVIDDPVIVCPADIQVLEHHNQPPTATFDVPISAKGSPPTTVSCSPNSGTSFGTTTTIVCEAIDSRARKGSCSFSVIVTVVPQLAKTTFVAFGDSLTEGKHKPPQPGILATPKDPSLDPPIYNEGGSYPEFLNTKLAARYTDQTITVIAFGRGGEEAGEGKHRLSDYWGLLNPSPDAVLLLEGTNDLTEESTGTVQGMNLAIASVIDALRSDIDVARQHGARPFLGTLPPMTAPEPPNVIAAASTLNARIQTLAAEQNVTLVNLNAVVPPGMIGIDGIHPAEGSQAYSLIADEWMKAIVQAFEVSAPAQ